MSTAIYFVSYKLKKDAAEADFLFAARALNDAFIAKQPGYLSWEQARDGETWVDMIRFQTMADLERFKEVSKRPNELALQFYSYINLNSCKEHLFSTVRRYGDF